MATVLLFYTLLVETFFITDSVDYICLAVMSALHIPLAKRR